jgi:aspartyl-tRNA(Asn)/glutamyl-tRNA(Gln) amidotransferase subunit C
VDERKRNLRKSVIIQHMIGRKDIHKLSTLSRLELSLEEKDGLAKDIEAILDYVKQVQEVAGQPHVPEAKTTLLKNVMREDSRYHESGEYTRDLLDKAPQVEKDHVKVRKILDIL